MDQYHKWPSKGQNSAGKKKSSLLTELEKQMDNIHARLDALEARAAAEEDEREHLRQEYLKLVRNNLLTQSD